MKINKSNYYLVTISSFSEFKKVKATLMGSETLFASEGVINACSYSLTDNIFYPAVSEIYAAIGDIASNALSFISPDWGKRLQAGWIDPFSSSFILIVTRGVQRLLEPIAICKPLDYPLLRPVSQSVIGLARFLDITLKDSSTILEIPSRATKFFTSKPHEAFASDYKTILGRISALACLFFYSIFWVVFKVIDIGGRFVQAIAHKIQFGRDFTDSFMSSAKSVDKIVRNCFIERIRTCETQVRKRVVTHGATLLTREILHTSISSMMRWALGKILFFSIAHLLKRGLNTNNIIIPIAQKQIAWIGELATLKMFVWLNFALKACACAAFFKEFTHQFSAKYKARDHTILYRKNLIDGVINYNRIKIHSKKCNVS